MRWMLQLAVILSPSLAQIAVAESTPTPRLVLMCAPCHGFEGAGHDETIPDLAGQNREYLRRQMLAFRSGERRHPTMNFFSGQVTLDEIDELINFYTSLARP